MNFFAHVEEMFSSPHVTNPYFSDEMVTVSYAFFTKEVSSITIRVAVIKEFVVKAQRRQGVGTQALQVIMKASDEHQTMLTLTPAPLPNQKQENPQEYRKGLLSFYSRVGFIANPFWKPMGWVDEITGKPWVADTEAQKLFSASAQHILSDAQFHQLVRPAGRKWQSDWLRNVESSSEVVDFQGMKADK